MDQPTPCSLSNYVPEVDAKFREALMRLIQLPDGLPAELLPRELNLDQDALCILEDFRRANGSSWGHSTGASGTGSRKVLVRSLRLAGVLVYLEWALQGPEDHSSDASGLEALRQIGQGGRRARPS